MYLAVVHLLFDELLTIPENFLTPAMLGVGYLEKREQRTLPVIWHPVTIHLMVGILSE